MDTGSVAGSYLTERSLQEEVTLIQRLTALRGVRHNFVTEPGAAPVNNFRLKETFDHMNFLELRKLGGKKKTFL